MSKFISDKQHCSKPRNMRWESHMMLISSKSLGSTIKNIILLKKIRSTTIFYPKLSCATMICAFRPERAVYRKAVDITVGKYCSFNLHSIHLLWEETGWVLLSLSTAFLFIASAFRLNLIAKNVPTKKINTDIRIERIILVFDTCIKGSGISIPAGNANLIGFIVVARDLSLRYSFNSGTVNNILILFLLSGF